MPILGSIEGGVKVTHNKGGDRRISHIRHVHKELVTIRVAVGAYTQQTRKDWPRRENSHWRKRPAASDHELTRDNEGRCRITQPQESLEPGETQDKKPEEPNHREQSDEETQWVSCKHTISTVLGKERNHWRRPVLLDWSRIPLQLRERTDRAMGEEEKKANKPKQIRIWSYIRKQMKRGKIWTRGQEEKGRGR